MQSQSNRFGESVRLDDKTAPAGAVNGCTATTLHARHERPECCRVVESIRLGCVHGRSSRRPPGYNSSCGENLMNIGEIARRAGVSRSTVSYALSGKRTVSEETRRRIEQVIAEVGLPTERRRSRAQGRPHPHARPGHPAGKPAPDRHAAGLRRPASWRRPRASTSTCCCPRPAATTTGPSNGSSPAGASTASILMEIRLEDARVARLQQTGLPFVDHRPHRTTPTHVVGRRRLRRPHRPVRRSPGRPRPPPHRAGQPLAGARRGGLRSRPPGTRRLHRGGRPARHHRRQRLLRR